MSSWFERLAYWRPPCVLRGIVVNLKGERENAIRGVLWRSRGAWLVLRNASVLEPRREPLAVDGEVLIHRDNVAFVQVLPVGPDVSGRG